ncbi:hypothetical protein PA598K_04188 [Paenibacillus sp. 598K]|uniref:hypothetical protein n=1 Tax=Paenibacillus sp. 598K TaxID=1117987 RepID=UPI000FFA0677|nr:hypothetical protein [Paenibacillus sp. 598K]GBF75757.1 hypothetical protein PA598K_04188 [Paenibacillus sp. 598K]
MEIGRRIYYDPSTGDVIVDTGERAGAVVETTIAQDFAVYSALARWEPENVGVLELDYGQHAEEFVSCKSYRIEDGAVVYEFGDKSDPA